MYVGIILAMVLTGSIHVHSERLSPWLDVTEDDMSEEYVRLDKNMSWWDAAYSGCERVGGTLAVVSSNMSELMKQMKPHTAYWVGAMETYTPWMWTETDEPLFKHTEDIESSRITSHSTILQDNSAFTCFQQCTVHSVHRVESVGLQGRRCFCNIHDHERKRVVSNKNVRCPGTYQEICGGREVVSIYELDLPASVKFIPQANDNNNCGYVKYENNKIVLHFQNCINNWEYPVCPKRNITHIRGADCESTICIDTSEFLRWNDANVRCGGKMSKLTDVNTNQLRQLFVLPQFKWSEFWVGLRRGVEWRWIDGRKASEVYHAFKTDRHESVSWYREDTKGYPDQSNKLLPSVCQLYKKTTTSSSSKTSLATKRTTTKTASTTAIAASTTRTEKQEIASPKWTFLGTSTLFTRMKEPQGTHSNNIPAFVGGSVGAVVLILVVALLMFVWSKRTQRLCFASRTTSEAVVCYNTKKGEQNEHSQKIKENGYTNTACSLEKETAATSNYEYEQFVLSSVNVTTTQRSNDVTYETVEDANDDDGDYSTPHLKNHLELQRVADDSALYSTAGPDAGENMYDHFADSGATKPKSPTGGFNVYSHPINSDSGDYDTTEKKPATAGSNIYSHVVNSDSGDYDTAERKAPKPACSDVYNHIVDPNTGDYNTTESIRPAVEELGLYNHLGMDRIQDSTQDSTESPTSDNRDGYRHIGDRLPFEKERDNVYCNVDQTGGETYFILDEPGISEDIV